MWSQRKVVEVESEMELEWSQVVESEVESGWSQGGVMGGAIVESGGVREEPGWSRVESSGDRVELGWILGSVRVELGVEFR